MEFFAYSENILHMLLKSACNDNQLLYDEVWPQQDDAPPQRKAIFKQYFFSYRFIGRPGVIECRPRSLNLI